MRTPCRLLAALLLLGACASSLPDVVEPAKPAEPPPPPPEPAQPFEPLLPVAPAEPPPLPQDPNAPKDLAMPPHDAKTTPSGLISKVLQPGTGTEHPGPEDTVTVHYTGWMKNGAKFDSSIDAGQPAQYIVDRVIPGWTEGLQLMVVGEKRRFWVPGRLAYGDEPRKFNRPYGTLVFDVQLLSLKKKPAPPQTPPDLRAPPADAQRTASGLVYRILRKGTGTRHPGPRDTVEVNYSGWTIDGKMFDSTVLREQPASFEVRGVIRGWTEGLQQLVVGDKARFWIPSALAYGDHPGPGSPAGPLVFDVELLGIAKQP
jgi:FKBP-type peptidyl-prolyl cis-trans isomerase